jgi:phosphatidylglycerol lysyltransferase
VLVILEIQHAVSRLLLIGASVLFVGFLLLVAGLYLLLREAGAPRWLMQRLPGRARSFAEQVRQHRVRPRDLLFPFFAALTAELFGVAMLYTCLRAIGQDPSISTALTAYAVGTIFVIVSPFFSGLGLVEVGMVLALRQFGIDSGSALAATLLFRALEVWMPLAIGLSLQVGVHRGVMRAGTFIPALLTLLTGITTVLSVWAPAFSERFNQIEQYAFVSVPALSRSFALVSGFMLIFLSYNLLRHRRVAWIAAVLLLAALIPAHLLKHHDESVALLAALTLGLLLITRNRYRVRSDIPLMRQGVVGFVAALAFALLYGTAGFFLIDTRAFNNDFSPSEAAVRTLRTFFSLGDSGLTPQTHYGAWFLDSIQIIGIMSLVYAVYSLMRPVVWRRTVYQQERERAGEIIERYGDSTLDFFKHWDDKLFYFGRGGTSVVSFGLSRSVAVGLGDPVAASDDEFRAVLKEFLEYCDTNGWRVAFHQTPPMRLGDYQDAGLKAVKIGEDAIVDLKSFTLSGGHMKSLRSNRNRLEREGYRVAYYPAPQTDERIEQLRAVSNDWLEIEGRRERGFTLGAFRDDYVRACAVFVVEDDNNNAVAFANIIPDGAAGETTIDLMRRRNEPPGVMDLLFVSAFEHLRDAGFQRFSLGMAPFARVGDDPDAPIPERIMGQLYEHLNRVFSYKGLHAYKDKFRPEWESRYLIYQSDADLPFVAYAIMRMSE